MQAGSRRFALILLFLAAYGCGPKQTAAPTPPAPPAPAPLQPKQGLIVLLPDPDGRSSSIVLTNAAGTQTLSDPYQAVRLQGSNAPPTAPFNMDQAEVKRVFGEVLDTLPAAQAVFTLYFDPNSEVLTSESRARIPEILAAIRERHSTSISVIGHTDTTATPKFNYRLGMRRAEGVARTLLQQGVEKSSISVESHGEADLAVQTLRGKAEPRNRRVEITVR